MRKFLSLLFAMMLMVGSMSATTIYCKVDKSWWKADGAAVAVHHWGGTTAGTTWPGVRMTPVKGEADTWSYDVPADVTGLMFVRVNASGAVADWGAKTADLTLPTDGKNLYTITSEAAVWGNPGVTGEWSVYGEEPITPVVPAKFYVTGDSALVDSLAWQSNAIKSESDTLVLKLAAGSYTLKVTVDGTWNTAKGYSDLTVKADGLSTDKDNNIHFTLAEAGTVKVIYTNELFKLEGNFYVEPIIPVVMKDLKLVPGVWVTDSAVLAAWTWGTEAEGAWSAFAGEGETLIAKVNEKADSVIFVRFEKNAAIDWASNVWNRYQAAIDSCGILYVNDWDNYTWCEAATPEPPVVPAKYYITGDSALVDSLAWQSNAIKSESDTLVLKLAAGSYTLKVTVDGTWATAKGYSDLTVKADGLSTDKDNNIHFTLAEAGTVKVIYTNELFKLEGNFYVEPVVVNYYAKYAAENGDWNWHALKEVEGKWLTDTIVYYGGGMNIHSAATDEGARYYAEIAGVAAKDTAYFTFNPADSTIAATVTGKYVAPVVPDPTVAVKGSMNAWGDSIPFVLAQDKLSASLTVENIKKGTYEFKMIINGEWRSNGYTYHRDFAGAAGITGNNDANMVLQLDADGQYTFTWTFANDSLGIIFPEKPANVLENGYYLVGKVVNDWTPAAQYLFAENTETAGEYMLSVNLTQGDSIKVVYVENDAIKTWYPGGDNYAVDANHVGTTTMYFRPNYDGNEGWFAGCIFIAPTGTVDVQNVATDTKAVKVLREGQVVIIRGEHIYTIMGQMIK